MDSTNLDNNRAVKVSHDGKNVYAVSWGSKTLVSWDRDMDTGVSAPLMVLSRLLSSFDVPAAFFFENSAYTLAFFLLFFFAFSLAFSLAFFSYISLR